MRLNQVSKSNRLKTGLDYKRQHKYTRWECNAKAQLKQSTPIENGHGDIKQKHSQAGQKAIGYTFINLLDIKDP